MSAYNLPDEKGHFGPYGGKFVAETLMTALEELRTQYLYYQADKAFQTEFAYELKHYVGRPTPIYHAKRWSDHLGGAQILLKREDLNHTGAHKINNTVGQALLAKRMNKKRVIAETGAGQHGVAGSRGRDHERIARSGDRFERGEHFALADLGDDLASGLRIEVEHADEFRVEAGGEFLGVITAEHASADDANPHAALMVANRGGRPGRGLGTLH